MADIGIDLGTTNSAVARLTNVPEIIEVHGQQTMPSAVAMDEDERLIGQSAKDNAVILDAVLSVKRHMGTDKRFALGDKSCTAPEISAMILEELKGAAEERLGEPVDNVVITTPAYFSDAQNKATLDAAKIAGMQSVQLLAEPVAAALAYGAAGSEDIVLVYDLGGGTFDVAVVDCFDFKMLGIDGNNYLGGDDFDKRLINHVVRQAQEQAGVDLEKSKEAMQLAKNLCEKAKKELSERESTRIGLMTVVGDKPVNFNLKIKREEFEALIKDLVDGTLEKVASAIKRAQEADDRFGGKEDIDAIILVGGSTYVPLVQRKLREFFDREPSKKVNPDLAVALGAAMKTATMHVKNGGERKLRIQLTGIPMVTASQTFAVKGKTNPGVKVEVSGGATQTSCEADERGRFSVDIDLLPDQVNDIVAVAKDDAGGQRKATAQLRHDSGFTGEEQVVEAVDGGVAGRLPWALGIGVTGQDNLLGVIIPQGKEVPCSVTSRDYCITSQNPGAPGRAPMPVFEGEIPYAPLNTHLGSLMLETPASPSTSEPVEINFRYTEDRILTVTASMVNYPDRKVTASLTCDSPSGENLHVIERADRLLNIFDGKLRPEEKARINKGKVALKDLCEQYRASQQHDQGRFEKIKQTGMKLKEDLNRIEAAYS